MNIQDIKVADHKTSAVSGAHTATILLRTEAALLCLQASALTTTDKSVGVTRALNQDAIRQLRRMPEDRSGAQAITTPTNARPTPKQQT